MNNRIALMQIIAIVSIISMLGSLYFSEVKNFIPCELCWYARILMYPIVILSVISAIRKELNVALYIAVFAGLGIVTTTYHYALQKVTFFTENLSMCSGNTCTVQYINWFGFVTIPLLALIGFIIIFIISVIIIKKEKS